MSLFMNDFVTSVIRSGSLLSSMSSSFSSSSTSSLSAFSPLPFPSLPSLSIHPQLAATLRSDFGHRISRGWPVQDFLRFVLCHDPIMARTRQRNTSAIVIARALIQRYGQSCVPGDRRRVHPAVAMRDIFNAVGLQLELNRDRLPCGAFRTCKNTGPELVPAIVFGCESDNWELAGVAVDVTENVMADNRLEKDLKVSVIPGRQPHTIPLIDTEFGRRMFLGRHNVNWAEASKRTSPWPIPSHSASTSQLQDSELVPAMRIRSMLLSGIRWYGTAMVVDGSTITLYYGDRFGFISSRPFDFIAQPELLVYVVAAISNAPPTALGFAPYLHLCKRAGAVGIASSRIEFSTLYNSKGTVVGPIRCTVDLGESQEIFNTPKVVGRGTNVTPVLITSAPYRQTGSHGVRAVIKTSIPAPGHGAEHLTIWRIRDLVKKHKRFAVDHIVKLWYAVDAPVSEIGLPRAFFGNVDGTSNSSVFRVMVMERYQPIADLVDEVSFKKVVIDVVKAHYWVWEYGRILHSDISDNNLMWHAKGGVVIGVLCDFDLARSRDDIEKDILYESLGHRSTYVTWGTLPFISCEHCLPGDNPVQTYKHDLEAFFWVLCLICAVNNPETRNAGFISAWDGTRVESAMARAEFLCETDDDRALQQIIDPHQSYHMYENIVEEWIKPLRRLFKRSGLKVFESAFLLRRMDGIVIEDLEDDLQGIRAEMEECPVPDFASFMACLDVDITDV